MNAKSKHARGQVTPAAVVCRGVTKDYAAGGSKVQALRGIDVEIPFGELSLLVGPSGCGKTTLISIIAGLLDATAGDVHVLGRDRRTLSGRRLVKFRSENIGFVFQQYNLLPALTAEENVAVPLVVRGVPKGRAVKAGAALLETVGLGERRRAFPRALSGGEQQRVAIARALIGGPRLLVCDEPTAALDARAGQNVMQLIRQVAVRPERSVIVVTHDHRVQDFGNRIISMSDGRVASVELLSCPNR
ncbi:MAG: ABC transporter ATP-binding protein [Planctomycetes bacterium]|nr:ABC transporter ATP-binding protein [Planctomycetota bacterium]